MPRIPVRNRESRISKRVTQGRVSRLAVGAKAQAVGQIGQKVAQFGLAMRERRAKMRDQKFALESSIRDTLEINDKMKKLQIDMPTDGQGYTENVKRIIENRFQRTQNEAPSQRAKNLYVNKVAGRFSEQALKAQQVEDERLVNSFRESYTNQLVTVANAQVSEPNLESAYDLYIRTAKDVEQGVGDIITREMGDNLLNQSRRLIRESYFNGVVLNGEKEHVAEAQAMLGTDIGLGRMTEQITPSEAQELGLISNEEKETMISKGEKYKLTYKRPVINTNEKAREFFMAGMTPSEKQGYIRDLMAKEDGANSVSKSSVRSLLREREAGYFEGVKPSSQNDVQFRNMVKSAFDEPDAARILMRDSIGSKMSDIVRTMRSTSANNWAQAEQSIEKKLPQLKKQLAQEFPEAKSLIMSRNFGKPSAQELDRQLGAMQEDIIDARQNDLAREALLVDQSVNTLASEVFNANLLQPGGVSGDLARTADEYVARSVGRQRALLGGGVTAGHIKILTDNQAARYASLYENAKNSEDRQRISQNLAAIWGPNWPTVKREIGFDSNRLAAMQIAQLFSNERVQSDIISASENREDTEQAFQTRSKSADDMSKARLSGAVSTQLAPITDAIMQSVPNQDRDVMVKEIEKVVISKAMSIWNENTDLTAEEAAELAQTRVMPVITAEADGMRIPIFEIASTGNLRRDQKRVQDFIKGHLSPEALKTFNPRPFKADFDAPENKGKSKALIKQEFLKKLSRSHVWRLNKDLDSLVLKFVQNGTERPVKDENDDPIVVPIRKISREPDKWTREAARLRGRGFFEKTGDFFKSIFTGEDDKQRRAPGESLERENFGLDSL